MFDRGAPIWIAYIFQLNDIHAAAEDLFQTPLEREVLQPELHAWEKLDQEIEVAPFGSYSPRAALPNSVSFFTPYFTHSARTCSSFSSISAGSAAMRQIVPFAFA